MSNRTAMEDRQARVLEVARQAFVRHGYKRVTMGDIAGAANLSRPALYLVYPSKEEIFTACLSLYFGELLTELKAGLPGENGVERKLVLAFELWAVRPFGMVLAAPDSKDLFESGRQFATDVVAAHFATFESIVGQLLKPLVQAQSTVRLPAIQIARLMVGAALGFKQSARDVAHLRQMIAGLIGIVLASLRP